MAALITLVAVPGHIEQYAGFSSKTVEIYGCELARTTTPAGTVGEVREAVRAFGTAIRARDPASSFAVLVSVRRGERKLPGFDATQHGIGVGQDDFLRQHDERQAARVEAPATDEPAPVLPMVGPEIGP